MVGVATHQGQMPCIALLVGYVVHLDQLRKLRFQRELELQIGIMLQEESKIMLFPNIITTVHYH